MLNHVKSLEIACVIMVHWHLGPITSLQILRSGHHGVLGGRSWSSHPKPKTGPRRGPPGPSLAVSGGPEYCCLS